MIIRENTFFFSLRENLRYLPFTLILSKENVLFIFSFKNFRCIYLYAYECVVCMYVCRCIVCIPSAPQRVRRMY